MFLITKRIDYAKECTAHKIGYVQCARFSYRETMLSFVVMKLDLCQVVSSFGTWKLNSSRIDMRNAFTLSLVSEYNLRRLIKVMENARNEIVPCF